MENIWPKQKFSAMVSYYGNVGENQTKLILPYPMRLAWDKTKTVNRITCHEKVSASLERVLKNILQHYGSLEKVQEARMDLFGGCLNVRRVRGGNSWSIHSWGTAIDLDPDQNSMSMHRDRATMPQAVIDIFAEESWVSMGQARDFDYMHFQAALL